MPMTACLALVGGQTTRGIEPVPAMPASAAARLLGKLGEAALKRYKEQGVWRAAPLSSMDIAELRKDHLLAGRFAIGPSSTSCR